MAQIKTAPSYNALRVSGWHTCSFIRRSWVWIWYSNCKAVQKKCWDSKPSSLPVGCRRAKRHHQKQTKANVTEGCTKF